MKKIFSFSFLFACVFPCLAQTSGDSLSLQFAEGWEGRLDEIVVTATRTPKALKDVPVQTRLITAEDIRRTDATNIQDLLQQELPGVEFSYAMNQQVNMNLAGFAGQSVLVLVDGERLAGETMDNVDFSRLLMSGVARIEIVKGAASALYGSNAAGGVINIITKAPLSPPEGGKTFNMSGNLNTRLGSHGEWRTGGELTAKGKRWSNTIDVNHYTIDTYNVCADNSDACDFRNVYGYRTWNFNERLTFNFGKESNQKPSPLRGGAGGGLLLTARAGYFFKERYYNPDTPDRYRDFSAGLRGQWKIDDRNNLELAYAFDQYDKSDFLLDRRLDIRDYRNVINSLRALYNHQLPTIGCQLTVGGDLATDYLSTYQFADGQAKRQTTADLFGQLDWTLDKHWEIVGAIRYDAIIPARTASADNASQLPVPGGSVAGSSKTSHRLTTKLNARYHSGRLTLRGGYAQGFRAPTLKERYMNFDMAGIFDIHGNPNLKPETSHNFNLSAEYSLPTSLGAYSFSLSSNFTLVDDKLSTSAIRYGQLPVLGGSVAGSSPYIDYINVESLRVFGLEATANGSWNCGLKAKLAYAYTHEQTAGGGVNQYCPARPHSLTASLNWGKAWNSNRARPFHGRNSRTDITLSARYLSAVSYDSMFMFEPFETKRVTNPAYSLWKLQLSQQLGKALQITAAVDNLFNYRPQTYFFNSPITSGTTFNIGLNLDIDKL